MSIFNKYINMINETTEDSSIFTKINFKKLNIKDLKIKESIIEKINNFDKESFIKQILNSESNEWKKTNDSYTRNITAYLYEIINELDPTPYPYPKIILETFSLYKENENLEFISPKGQKKYLEYGYYAVASEPISNPITLKINKAIIFEKESEKNMNEIINAIMNGLIRYINFKEKKK